MTTISTWAERSTSAALILCLASLLAGAVGFVANSM